MKYAAMSFALGLQVAASGCYSYHASVAPLPQDAVHESSSVRVIIKTGTAFDIVGAVARGDSIVGRDAHNGFQNGAAVKDVAEIQMPRFDVARSAGLAVGVVAALAALFTYAAFHIDPWPSSGVRSSIAHQ